VRANKQASVEVEEEKKRIFFVLLLSSEFEILNPDDLCQMLVAFGVGSAFKGSCCRSERFPLKFISRFFI
jgi:hypothetical protein